MTAWIDVASTAIPRLVTKRCIDGFFRHADRDGYLLRWIVHLDRYPPLEHLYDENLEMIHECAKRFDDARVLTTDRQRGLGLSFYLVLLNARQGRHVFLMEDDWEIVRPFSIRKMIETPSDAFHLLRWTARVGGFGVGLLKSHAIQRMVDRWPMPPERPSEAIYERYLVRTCRGLRGQTRREQRLSGIGTRAVRDIGRQAMADLGFETNAIGIPLAEHHLVEAREKRDGQV